MCSAADELTDEDKNDVRKGFHDDLHASNQFIDDIMVIFEKFRNDSDVSDCLAEKLVSKLNFSSQITSDIAVHAYLCHIIWNYFP